MSQAIGVNESLLEKVLSRHYGDGLVYLPKSFDFGVLRDAMKIGLVSDDGYLTRKGRNFLASRDCRYLRG